MESTYRGNKVTIVKYLSQLAFMAAFKRSRILLLRYRPLPRWNSYYFSGFSTFLRSFNVHQKLVCHHYSGNLQRRLPGYQSIDNIAAHRLGWALKGVTPAPSARCYAYQPISFCNPARDFRLKGFLSS